MSKYLFHEIKKLKELPDDVNKLCTDALSKIDPSGEMVAFFKDKEKKKRFGTLNFLHPKTNRLIASFEMHHGVCKMFKLVEFMGKTDNHFFGTIMNDTVSFEKGKRNEK